MAPTKQVSRKELLSKPDRFITFVNKVLLFADTNKVKLLFGLGTIILFILIFSAVRYFSNKAENDAFTMLNQIIVKYETALNDNGLDPAYHKVEKDFELIFKKYSGKTGGEIARIVFGDMCYQRGDFEKAIKLYSQALQDMDNNNFFKSIIFRNLGYCHEEMHDYKSSAAYFEMIVSEPDCIMKDEAYFHLGQLYAHMGKNDKSVEAFNKILSDYTDSIYIELVKERLTG